MSAEGLNAETYRSKFEEFSEYTIEEDRISFVKETKGLFTDASGNPVVLRVDYAGTIDGTVLHMKPRSNANPNMPARDFTFIPVKQQIGSGAAAAGVTWVDRFEQDVNLLGRTGRAYTQEPSKIEARRIAGTALSRNGKVLRLEFSKRGEGGPYGNGGWCGYTISLGHAHRPFDASKYSNLVFWLRGQSGGENFKVGLTDARSEPIKSEDIVHYVPAKKITAKWQKVRVPLDIFYIDHQALISVSIDFATDCFPNGAGRGTVYLDDLGFE